MRLLSLSSNDLPVIRAIRRRALQKLLGVSYVSIGSSVRIDRSHPELGGSLVVEDGVEIGAGSALDISGGLRICAEVTLSEGVRVFSHDHTVADRARHWREQTIQRLPLVIHQGSWVGAGATILGSCGTIGEGAIVGAGAVVTKPVEPWTIVAGNPAKRIGSRS